MNTPLPGAIYWGAYIRGDTYGLGNPPWDWRSVDQFNANAGKNMSVLHWGEPWFISNSWPYGYYPFDLTQMNNTRSHGVIPLIDWLSWDLSAGGSVNQPNFALYRIIHGDRYGAKLNGGTCDITIEPTCTTFDQYFTTWATAARNWGYPFFIDVDEEMNGNWEPWSEQTNGNSAGEFVLAWRHVHNIFTSVGASNVTWIWNPNAEYPGSTPLAGLYPGDAYTDWTGIDGFNKNPGYQTWDQIFAATYADLGTIAPTKPIFVSQVASNEYDGDGTLKGGWITDMLQTRLITNYPMIKAFAWWEWNQDGAEIIESSAKSQAAFRAGIASSHYAANAFGGLPAGSPVPIPSP